MSLPYSRVIQNAYVVTDIEAAARRWNETFGIGPFVLLENIRLPNVLYRGQPAEMELSAALAQAGNIQVELIQQHSDGPSCYRDVYAEGEEGFHHVAMLCEDFDKEFARYEAMGCPAAMSFGTDGTRTAYMDARNQIGSMVELYSDYQGIRDLYRMVAEVAETWPGEQLLIPR